jgi:pilus assembly protein CpaB
MKRYRTLIVMGIAVATAAAASFGVYTAIQTMPIRQVEIGTVPVVVAVERIAVGTRLTTNHLKVIDWPARTPLTGAFADPKELVDRGVIATLAANEPVTNSKVAIAGVGAGLPPVIPQGMRAMSVKVNEVIGVAGFVLPGTRVDVLVTVREDGGEGTRQPMSRTVVSNTEVLTAGTRYDEEEAKGGKPIKSTVVTLAVLPEDAERIALASAEGQVSLALRNPLDVDPTATSGIRLAALMRGPDVEPVFEVKKQRMVAVRRPPPPPPPAPAIAVPAIYKVETIRAAKRGEEVVQ